MSATSDYYQAQADNCGMEAANAPLPAIREKFVRSQHAWQALADRIMLTEIGKRGR